MKNRKLLIALTFLILLNIFITFSQTQEGQQTSLRQSVLIYAGWWWLIFIIGIIFIIAGIALRNIFIDGSKWILYIGLFCIFLAIFFAEFIYILPLIGPLGPFKIPLLNCEQIQSKDILTTIACVFSGVAPSGYETYAWLVWFIFIFILPLAILMALFFDFTKGLLGNSRAENVIAFAASLIAYKALMSIIFIEFITIGFGGVALFFINILFFGWVIKGIRRLFYWTTQARKMMEIQDLARFDELMRIREELYGAYMALIRAGNWEKAKEMETRIEELNKKIQELARKLGKEAPGIS